MTQSYSHCSCGTKLKIMDVRYPTYGHVESVHRKKVCPSGCETKIETIEIPLDLVIKVFGQKVQERPRNRPYRAGMKKCKTA